MKLINVVVRNAISSTKDRLESASDLFATDMPGMGTKSWNLICEFIVESHKSFPLPLNFHIDDKWIY